MRGRTEWHPLAEVGQARQCFVVKLPYFVVRPVQAVVHLVIIPLKLVVTLVAELIAVHQSSFRR